MSDDLDKLKNKILALTLKEKEMLLNGLIEALVSDAGANSRRHSIAEAAAPAYQVERHPVLGEGAEAMQGIPGISKELSKEGGEKMDQLDRITQQAGMMGGKACIRGLRVTVGMIVGQIAAGAGIDDLLTDYPYLEREDIMQALRYAAWRAEEREVILAAT